jgi:hypothetical protein
MQDHRADIVAGIIASAAFLEAAINELISDACDGTAPPYSTVLPEERRGVLKHLWGGAARLDRLSPLDKADAVLVVAGLPPFEHGTAPFQEANLLVSLRNLLVHYKPEWIEHSEIHAWEKKLSSYHLAENPLVSSANPYWPDRLFSSSLAQWSLASAVAFLDDFFHRLNAVPIYEDHRKQLSG